MLHERHHMSDDIYDDPSLSTGDFLKLEKVGDGVTGELLAVSLHTWPDGDKCPKLVIRKDDGDEIIWTAGQIQAKALLKELRPRAGQRIKVELTQIEKRAGGKTLKHIDIKVAGNASTTPAAEPVAVAAGSNEDPWASTSAGDEPRAWTSAGDEPPF